MSVGVQYMREHIPEKARIHSAITDTGGISPNVVQDRAEALYLIRSPQTAEVMALFERVKKVANGAAMMSSAAMARSVSCPSARIASQMSWLLPEKPIRRRLFGFSSVHRSRFLASVRHLFPAGFPIPAGALGRPTSPHVSLYSSDKPNQQHCTHRSRSDWRSRRPHPYHRSLFTDFLHCGAANCGVGLQSVHYDRAPDFVDFG